MEIGWESDVYRVSEHDQSLLVCATLFSGNISGNISLNAYYDSGNATGMLTTMTGILVYKYHNDTTWCKFFSVFEYMLN